MQSQMSQHDLGAAAHGRLNGRLTVTFLLASGIVSTLLYVAMDVIASLRYEGYSYADQTISELSAVGAPTRSLWIPFGVVYGLLVIAFGLGVWASAGTKRALRIVAVLLAVMGVLSLVAWPFAPMHQREVLAAGGSTVSDTMHLVLAGVISLLFFLMIGFGAMAFGKRFRLFSVAIILAVLVFGALTGLDAPKIQDNEPTPWLGLKERVAVEGSMLWMAVLGIALLRARRTAGEPPES